MDVRAPGVGEKRSAELDPELLEEDVELFAGGRGHAAAPVRPAAKARIGLLMDLQGLEVKGLDETEAEKVTFEDEEVAMEMTAVSGTKGDVPELFGGGYFVEASKATALNLTPGTTYDLRTGLNLRDPKVRGGVWEDLERQKQAIVVGSPMCAASNRAKLRELPLAA